MKLFPLSSWVTATVSLDGGEMAVVLVVVTTLVVVVGEGYTTLAGGAYAVPLGAIVPLDAEADRDEGWIRVVVVGMRPRVVSLGSPGATSEAV